MHIVESRLPTKYGTFVVRAYNSQFAEFPDLALMNRDGDEDVVDVRIHSECMTGDVFSSAKCDCGEQLDFAMKWVQENKGVVIYLRQEGRGIGLVNKLHAYNLQEEGYDTKEANLKLGFHEDSRDYSSAVAILDDLNITKIRLMTNNPEKINGFENTNVTVVERIPIEITPNETNIDYLLTKKNEMGHLFSSHI